MPRYNTSLATGTINGATTISSPYQGAFTELTGTAPYTVTLPSPSLYPGSNQTFYNATGGTITLATPSGSFAGTGGSGTSSLLMYNGNVASVTSDGTNYIVISEDGSALVATTATISGDVTMNGGSATVTITPSTLNISPTGTANINNVIIGASTRAAGSFTSLNANSQTSLTANIASTNTTSGTLVVTGGIGATGQITATTLSATTLTGTLSTASQTNITSVGTLGSLTVTNDITTSSGKLIPSGKSITIPSTVTAGWYRFAQGTATAVGENGSRGSFRISVISTGGYMSPGQTVIYGFKDWSGTAQISEVVKTGTQYFSQWRIATTSTIAYLEGYTAGWSMGGSNSMNITAEPYGFNPSVWTPITDSTLTAGLGSSTITINNPTLTIDSNNQSVIIGSNVSPRDKLDVTGGLYLEGNSANWGEVNPGTSRGTIHLDPGVTTDNYGNAITFGASDSGAGETAHAGIYVRSDGSYGTKMYLATTDSYANGPKVRLWIDADGKITLGSSTYNTNLQVNGPAKLWPYPNDGVRWIDTDNSPRTNWQGSTSQRTAWGLYWKYNDSNVRAAITYDHASSEEFQFASGYGPFVFNSKARNGNLNDPNEGTEVLRLDTQAYGGVSMPNTSLTVSGSITLNTAGPGYIKYAFFTASTYGGNQYVHMKTDQRTNNSNMYRIEATGYDYGSAQVIGGAWSGYLYSGSDSIISVGRANWGNRTFCYSEYKSTDGYLVLVADTASYYNSFVLHYQAGATGVVVPTITAWTQSTATSGVY